MSSLWVMLLVIWVVVEVIQWLRKKPLKARLKAAAIWATVMTSLTAVGQMDPRQNALVQFGVCLLMFGIGAAIIYGVRVAVSPKSARVEASPTRPDDTLRS